jgi:hypothetical protein
MGTAPPAALVTAVCRLHGLGSVSAREAACNADPEGSGYAVEINPWCTSAGWRASELLAWAAGRVPGASLELLAPGPSPTGRPRILLTVTSSAAGVRLAELVNALAPSCSRAAVQAIRGLLPCPGWEPPRSPAAAHEQLLAEVTRQLEHEQEAWRRQELARQVARLAAFRIPRKASVPRAMPARLRWPVELLRRLLTSVQREGLTSETHRLQTLGRVLRLLEAIRRGLMRPCLPHRKGCSGRLAGLEPGRLVSPSCNRTHSLGRESAP